MSVVVTSGKIPSVWIKAGGREKKIDLRGNGDVYLLTLSAGWLPAGLRGRKKEGPRVISRCLA